MAHRTGLAGGCSSRARRAASASPWPGRWPPATRSSGWRAAAATGDRQRLIEAGIRPIVGDLATLDLTELPAGITHVFHAAARFGHEVPTDWQRVFETNAQASGRLVAACSGCGLRLLLERLRLRLSGPAAAPRGRPAGGAPRRLQPLQDRRGGRGALRRRTSAGPRSPSSGSSPPTDPRGERRSPGCGGSSPARTSSSIPTPRTTTTRSSKTTTSVSASVRWRWPRPIPWSSTSPGARR